MLSMSSSGRCSPESSRTCTFQHAVLNSNAESEPKSKWILLDSMTKRELEHSLCSPVYKAAHTISSLFGITVVEERGFLLWIQIFKVSFELIWRLQPDGSKDNTLPQMLRTEFLPLPVLRLIIDYYIKLRYVSSVWGHQKTMNLSLSCSRKLLNVLQISNLCHFVIWALSKHQHYQTYSV